MIKYQDRTDKERQQRAQNANRKKARTGNTEFRAIANFACAASARLHCCTTIIKAAKTKMMNKSMKMKETRGRKHKMVRR
mmetsp:Transcript_29185/g.75128  ORF Transcript_29185/g.75128 Transcript_29185/m.75128 type:complete len:80 (+) Transcript_29185:40-279(+)